MKKLIFSIGLSLGISAFPNYSFSQNTGKTIIEEYGTNYENSKGKRGEGYYKKRYERSKEIIGDQQGSNNVSNTSNSSLENPFLTAGLILGGIYLLGKLSKPKKENYTFGNVQNKSPLEYNSNALYGPKKVIKKWWEKDKKLEDISKNWWDQQVEEAEEIWGESENKLDKTKKTASYIVGQKIPGGKSAMKADELSNKGLKNWWDQQVEEAEEIYGGNNVNQNINTGIYVISENVPYGKEARKAGEKIGEKIIKTKK